MAERRNQLIVIGQGRENFRRRERNVDEKPILLLRATIAQRLSQWNQVIVMHPQDIIRPQQFFEMSGEILVDPK